MYLSANSSADAKIILPCARRISLENFQTKVENISKRAQIDAQRSGSASPILVLFSETSLRYVFNISQTEVLRSIDKMQQTLPRDIEMAVGFSVLENYTGRMRNRGYLFTSYWYGSSFKRNCTIFDKNRLSALGQMRQVHAWKEEGKKMEIANFEFASIQLTHSLNVELRVCLDVISSPIARQENTITLVPAYNLDPGEAATLSANRHRVVINDGGDDWRGNYRIAHTNTIYRSTNQTTHQIEV